MINQFRKEYSWLSNFTEVDIVYDNVTYPSVENFYVAMKTLNDEDRVKISKMSASEVKKYGETLKLRSDWDDIKLDVMCWSLCEKFKQEPFKSKLLATKNENIVEGNYWGDTFWGVDLKQNPNIGENYLGRILMKVREVLKNENKKK